MLNVACCMLQHAKCCMLNVACCTLHAQALDSSSASGGAWIDRRPRMMIVADRAPLRKTHADAARAIRALLTQFRYIPRACVCACVRLRASACVTCACGIDVRARARLCVHSLAFRCAERRSYRLSGGSGARRSRWPHRHRHGIRRWTIASRSCQCVLDA